MALTTCPDCSKEISDAAPACPHCGRPMVAVASTPQGAKPAAASGCASGCLLVILMFGAWIFFTSLFSGPSTSSTTPAPARSAPAARPAPPAKPPLEVQSWSWSEEYGYVTAEGQVKNVSTAALENVQVVVSIYTKDGTFITSADALLTYNPILPGQTSPFKAMTTANPAMKKANIAFKSLFGGEIAHTTRAKK